MRSLQIGDSIAYLSIKNRQLVAYPRSDEETAKQAPLEDLDAVVLETLNGLGLNLHVLQGFIENNADRRRCPRRFGSSFDCRAVRSAVVRPSVVGPWRNGGRCHEDSAAANEDWYLGCRHGYLRRRDSQSGQTIPIEIRLPRSRGSH